MPPKIILSDDQIVFVNVAYAFIKSNGLNIAQTLPAVFHSHFNQMYSYNTLAKCLNSYSINSNIRDELISISNLFKVYAFRE